MHIQERLFCINYSINLNNNRIRTNIGGFNIWQFVENMDLVRFYVDEITLPQKFMLYVLRWKYGFLANIVLAD